MEKISLTKLAQEVKITPEKVIPTPPTSKPQVNEAEKEEIEEYRQKRMLVRAGIVR